MPPRPLSANGPRIERLRAWATPQEHASIQKAAADAGMKPGEFLRTAALALAGQGRALSSVALQLFASYEGAKMERLEMELADVEKELTQLSREEDHRRLRYPTHPSSAERAALDRAIGRIARRRRVLETEAEHFRTEIQRLRAERDELLYFAEHGRLPPPSEPLPKDVPT